MREHRRVQSEASLDGPSLLKEQTQLLSESTPADINFLHFLKLRLSAQQRATAQRNYWQRAQQEADAENTGAAAATMRSGAATSAEPTAIPIVDTEAYPTASAPNTRSSSGQAGGGGPVRNASAHAVELPHYGSRSPQEESSMHSGSVASRLETSFAPPLSQHSFDDVPASAAKRSMTSDPAIGARTHAPGSVDGRAAAAVDEMPAVASGTPQLPADAEYMKNVTLEPCPHCGRTFAADRLPRHAATCERQQLTNPKPKAEGKERKVSTASTSSRTKSERSVTAPSVSKSPVVVAAAAAGAPPAAARTEKWRRQSAQLRSAMAGTPMAEDDRVPCPHCGRRFAPDAADRHIPICKAKEERHP